MFGFLKRNNSERDAKAKKLDAVMEFIDVHIQVYSTNHSQKARTEFDILQKLLQEIKLA